MPVNSKTVSKNETKIVSKPALQRCVLKGPHSNMEVVFETNNINTEPDPQLNDNNSKDDQAEAKEPQATRQRTATCCARLKQQQQQQQQQQPNSDQAQQ
jgi:microcompartment protein CcmL/EutN